MKLTNHFVRDPTHVIYKNYGNIISVRRVFYYILCSYQLLNQEPKKERPWQNELLKLKPLI